MVRKTAVACVLLFFAGGSLATSTGGIANPKINGPLIQPSASAQSQSTDDADRNAEDEPSDPSAQVTREFEDAQREAVEKGIESVKAQTDALTKPADLPAAAVNGENGYNNPALPGSKWDGTFNLQGPDGNNATIKVDPGPYKANYFPDTGTASPEAFKGATIQDADGKVQQTYSGVKYDANGTPYHSFTPVSGDLGSDGVLDKPLAYVDPTPLDKTPGTLQQIVPQSELQTAATSDGTRSATPSGSIPTSQAIPVSATAPSASPPPPQNLISQANNALIDAASMPGCPNCQRLAAQTLSPILSSYPNIFQYTSQPIPSSLNQYLYMPQ